MPNIASKAFLSLKNLALKAYLKVRLEISDLGRLPPILNPSPQARTAARGKTLGAGRGQHTGPARAGDRSARIPGAAQNAPRVPVARAAGRA